MLFRSIAFEIRDDLVDDLLPYIKQVMEHGLPFDTEIPFKVDFKLGERWGSTKEVEV